MLTGDPEKIAKLAMPDLEKILAATLTGMTVDQFQSEVKIWLGEARDHRWKKPYTDLTYQPMQEVLADFRANDFKTYIVTGGGQALSAFTPNPPTAFPLSRSSAALAG